MSGIFGTVDSQKRSPSMRLRCMADSLCQHQWTCIQTGSDEQAGVGLGQVNIGILATDAQPLWSEDRALAVVFFGELYYTEPLRRQLVAAGYSLDMGTEAELILRLYQAKGEDFVHDLEGVFVLALWDATRGRLFVANDRFGLIPTYYAHYDGKLVFSPLVKGILTDSVFEKRLDLTSMAQFLRFQRLLGDGTFFEGLHLLPYASLLRFDQASDTLDVAHYWDFDQIPQVSAGIGFEDAVVEAGRLLRRAVEVRTQGDYRAGVYLSGGLDSRTLLGLASQMRSSVPSLTYGVPGCRDAYYAERIARRLKSQHHFFPLKDGRWVREGANAHLEATEGFAVWTHCHAAATLPLGRKLADVNLTGFGGDQVLGGRAIYYSPLLRLAPDQMAFDCQAFSYLNQAFSWPGITEAEERNLYLPTVYAEVAGRAFDSLREQIGRFSASDYARKWDHFATIHQGTRLSNLNVVYQRTFFEARYPFCDYALVDFVYAIPIDYRLRDRLYLAVINQEVPAVAWVPRDIDDMLLVDKGGIRWIHGLWQKLRRRVTGQRRPIIHEDPEGWLRNDLRDWAEELLFDSRTLERGIFNPMFVRSIFERHMSGHELHTIGKIAPIMTYEMMLRRFYDD